MLGDNDLDLGCRFLRQEMLPLYKDSNLAQKKVGIIGVGGVGGICSLLLAVAGVGTLKIADSDVVAAHNLHRQLLFSEQDLGKSKVALAKQKLEAHNSQIKVSSYGRIDESNFSDFCQDLDVILDVTDDSQSRLKISKLALEHHVDLISGAVSGYTALLAIFAYHDPKFIQQYGCYRCVTAGAQINTKVGITGPLAASASSLVAHLCLEYLLGNHDFVGKLIRYDLKTLTLSKLKLTKDPMCVDCQAY